MAAEPPLSRIVLRATSVADDLGFVALGDLAAVVAAEGATHRLIGGHMVTALVARWGLGPEFYRETGDSDLGVPPMVITGGDLLGRLRGLGYEQTAGNRFAREISDIPIRLDGGGDEPRRAVVDVLVPSYTSRVRQNRRIGEDLVTTEVPGLAFALKRPAIDLDLHLSRLNGDERFLRLSFPDEVAALVLKANATTVRSKDTDIIDVWRCLEVALAAAVVPSEFDDGRAAEAKTILRKVFQDRKGPGMAALVAAQGLSAEAGDVRYTRVRALLDRVLGPG